MGLCLNKTNYLIFLKILQLRIGLDLFVRLEILKFADKVVCIQKIKRKEISNFSEFWRRPLMKARFYVFLYFSTFWNCLKILEIFEK